MTISASAWREGLLAFAAEHRARRPLAEMADRDAAAWNAERAIIAASLAPRLAALPEVDSTRSMRGDVEPDAAIVITSSPAGIGAANTLVADSPDLTLLAAGRLVAVTELEYRLWCIQHPDDDHRRHVALWSWVKTRVPEQRWPEFAAFPLAEGEAYWLHREGLAGAGPLDRRSCHLWKWNGRFASLLAAFITEQGL
ncbi:MAG: hypothetical protein ACKO4T_09625 [Planctomycetaceae bacterium]